MTNVELFLFSLDFELGNLLERRNLESSIGLRGISFKNKNFRISDLHITLHIVLVSKGSAGLIMELLHQSCQLLLAHSRDVGHGAKLGGHCLWDTHPCLTKLICCLSNLHSH